MVHKATRVDFVKKEKKTSTVRTVIKTGMSLNNVTAIRSVINNARTATRRFTKKNTSRKKKNMTRIN